MPNRKHELILDTLLTHYDLKGELQAMVAYQDMNYLLSTPEGDKYIVKITGDPGELEFVHAQEKVFKALSSSKICKPIETQEHKGYVDLLIGDSIHPLRVFPFVAGEFLAETKPQIHFYSDFGELLAYLYLDLLSVKDAALMIQTHEWDLARFQEFGGLVDLIKDPEIKRLVGYFFMQHKEKVQPSCHLLPKGLIHGDANNLNVIVDDLKSSKVQAVKALIDFGDMVYSARIYDLAIALSYALMDRENTLEISAAMLISYHIKVKLSPLEISQLYYLIAARLCTTIVHAAKKSFEQPDSEYHQVSANPAKDLLMRWIKLNPFRFENEMLEACGYEPMRIKSLVSQEIKAKIKERHSHMSEALSVSYNEPIEMIGSALQYMYSADGKTYLDCVNNIPHVGHCHPKVVAAGQRQMASLNTNTRYIYDNLNEYARKLLATFPSSLSKVFFVNSGSAATDLAVRIAKNHTGRERFQVLDHAYHGNTSTAIGLSPYKFNRKGGSGQPIMTDIIGLKDKEKYKESRVPESRVPEYAAFIAESIPGCAGQVMLDKDFMQEKVSEIRENGGLYIADEVQTGFGRVGEHFWGFELYDIVPDIVILGKPIANGHPMGAVICTEEVAKSFETGMEFFSSFGGNPVSCEIANAVLDVIDDEKLQVHAKNVGSFLLAELREMQERSQGAELSTQKATIIKEVRGIGLFLGIELVKDIETGEPDPDSASIIVNDMKSKGFLLSTDGPFENVIKFKPPMIFTKQNAKELITALKETLE